MSCGKFHSKLNTDDGIHTMIAYEFADSTERLAFSPESTDLGKVVRQVNTNAYFIISQTAPLNYVELTGLLPLSAKGDLLSYNGGAIAALPVGTDGQVLLADSAEVTGLKWDTVATADEQVKVSFNDTTTGYLEDKLVTSNGVNTTNPLEQSTLNDGADEDLQIQFDETKVQHDNLAGFVGNEHIDHSAVTITGSNGLTGGGDITASRTIEMPDVVVAGSSSATDSTLDVTVDAKGRITAFARTAISILSTAITDFTEAVQDAVGTIFTDSASVDFTYNDVGNTITASVIPGGVDHDALNNFVANEHIDHSAVSITGSDGLAGGGDITASRTITLPNVGTSGSSSAADSTQSITVDAKGRVTAFSRTAISILSSAVTDFASAVRSTVLTGLSTATSTAVVATDSILVAIGKLQGQLNSMPSGNCAQYSNSTSQATSANLDLEFQTDRESELGSLFSHPTNQDIRTLFAGRVGVYFKISAFPNANDRGWTASIKKNGSVSNYTTAYAVGKNTTNRRGTASFYAEFDCAINDDFRINLNSLEGASITVPVNSGFFGVKAVRVD